MGCKKNQKKMSQGENARQVSSSKRRSGIFKMAGQLSTLCAGETALVVFSSDGKAFSMGHPCSDAIMNSLADPENAYSIANQHQAEHEARLRELHNQYAEALEQLEFAKRREKELEKLLKATRGKSLVGAPIDELNLRQLKVLEKQMEELKGNLWKRIGGLSVQTSDPTACSSANAAEAFDPSVTNPAEGSNSVDLSRQQ